MPLFDLFSTPKPATAPVIPAVDTPPISNVPEPGSSFIDLKELPTMHNLALSGEFSGTEVVVAYMIQRRRFQMLIHSHIYYVMNRNIISDKQFDTWAHELVALQKLNPEIAKKVIFHEHFETWDGTTGFHLPLNDPWVRQKANYILMLHERGEY